MKSDNPRVTMIMGAGSVLDMDFPNNVIIPTTKNITDEVRKPYDDVFNREKKISIVDDIYQFLINTFPSDLSRYWEQNSTPNIHFEILFHVMEQLNAYESVWTHNNHNPNQFPYFAPFTSQNFNFNSQDLFQVMWRFIMRIMNLVNDYNEYFRNDGGNENWYREFFESNFKWDVFNFNYDTTVEQCLEQYEDGFEPIDKRIDSIFRPQKLFENVQNLSTINHIHGCINYYYKDDPNNELFETNIHDLYCYPNFDEVKKRMEGRGQSNSSSQNNEEYFAGPILTGLRKTEKLICMPYDFYHGNLHKAIVNNNAMVIVGYSFGDIYVNNLINRMHSIWQGKERIVLIDKWDANKIQNSKINLEHYLQTLSIGEVEFLETMSECSDIYKLMDNFISTDIIDNPKCSKNGCLMLIAKGMKYASKIRNEIYSFLES